MRTVASYTLGCKVNQYDTQAMCEILEKKGYSVVSFTDKADVYIINTCTVTAMADKKSRQIISRAVRNNPDAVVCVCGCMAQKDAEELLDMEGVSCVVGTQDRNNIYEIICRAATEKVNAVRESGNEFENLSISSSGDKTRANIKIQEGCNNFCSYCIIPYVRGRERSRDFNSIMREAENVSQSGVSEIVLTGIHVSSYNSNGNDLADLVNSLSEIGGIKRIRLGSLEQTVFREHFIEKLSRSDKLCPHFHISLQSGSDKILELMNRKYTKEDYSTSIELLRQYFDNPAITTDIITGFPNETEEDFIETCEYVKATAFSRIHVFPFSGREGTKAYDMKGQVPVNIRRCRANALIEIGKKLEHIYLESFLGKEETVLLEQKSENGLCMGYTTRYAHVETTGEPGEYKNLTIKILKNNILY